MQAILTSDSPALVGSTITFVVNLVFPRCQTEDVSGNIVYEKNCRNGKECYSCHRNRLVLLLETYLINLKAHRYFCMCKMLLSHVTPYSNWVTGRGSHINISQTHLSKQTNGFLPPGTFFKSYIITLSLLLVSS